VRHIRQDDDRDDRCIIHHFERSQILHSHVQAPSSAASALRRNAVNNSRPTPAASEAFKLRA
jgi:hypothetical protein